jgi:PAS domain S-box-containing protein
VSGEPSLPPNAADAGEVVVDDREPGVAAAFEHAAVGLAIVARDGRLLRANDRLREILGGTTTEPLKGLIRELIEQDGAQAPRPLTGERQVRRSDGTGAWVSITLTPAEPANGTASWVVSLEDVTRHRRAERRLAAQAALSQVLAGAEDSQRALPDILRAIGEGLGWEVGAFWGLGADDRLRHQAIWHVENVPAEEFIAMSRAIGFARGEGVPGRVWQERRPIWYEDVSVVESLPRHRAAAKAGLHGAFAFPVVRGDEVSGVFEFFSRFVEPPDDQLLALVSAFATQVRDSLERRTAEHQARDSDAFHRAILQSALDCIITMDHTGRITEFNPAAERTFGFARADVLGRRMADVIIPPELRDAHQRGLARYLETGEAHVLGRRIEVSGLRADGTRFPVELAIVRIPLDGPPAFTGYLRDISDRKRAEETQRFLVDASAQLASSLDYETTLANLTRLSVPTVADWCAVDVIREDGDAKRVAIAHLDQSKVKIVTLLDERYPSRADAPHGVARVIRTGEPELVPEISDDLLRAVARDEEHLRLMRALGLRSYLCVPLTHRGEVLGALSLGSAESGRRFNEADLALAQEIARRAATAIDNARLFREMRDAREQLEDQASELEVQAQELFEAKAEMALANEKLQKTNDELIAQTADAERARKAADEANHAKSQFLAMMSHELRTPLNAIGGYAQLLELGVRGQLTDAQRADVERIRRSQVHLLGLVNDILNFAKLEAGQVKLSIAPAPVEEMLAALEEFILPQVEAKGIAYERRRGNPTVAALTDRERAQQAIVNLLSNAIKFTEPGGRIVLDWTADDRQVAILVHDTGRGIPAGRLDEIFEPFVQVDRHLTQGGGEGVGLGLAISRDIARAMGGDLTAVSAPGVGSTFTLTLPRAT